jgi:hypothetical protein
LTLAYSTRPGDVIRELTTLLHGHGLTRLYWAASALTGVLSVSNGVTVWSDGQTLICQVAGNVREWPAWDTSTAADELASLAGCSVPGSRASLPI